MTGIFLGWTLLPNHRYFYSISSTSRKTDKNPLLAWLWTLLKYLESDRIQVATNLRYFHGWSNYFYRNIWLDFQDFAGGFFFSTSIGSQSRILMGKEGKFNNFASSWDPSSNGHARIPPSLRSSWAIQDRYQFQSCWDLGLLIPSALN